jgi:hypothetical protein
LPPGDRSKAVIVIVILTSRAENDEVKVQKQMNGTRDIGIFARDATRLPYARWRATFATKSAGPHGKRETAILPDPVRHRGEAGRARRSAMFAPTMQRSLSIR